MGHNSELTPGERRALTLHHAHKIAAADAKMREHRDEKNRLKKLARADGIPVADINFALKLMDPDKRHLVVQEVSSMILIAQDFGVGHQFELFEKDRTPAVDKAFEEGVTDGYMGISANSGYANHTDTHDAYMRGWREAQDKRLAEFKSAQEKLHGTDSKVANQTTEEEVTEGVQTEPVEEGFTATEDDWDKAAPPAPDPGEQSESTPPPDPDEAAETAAAPDIDEAPKEEKRGRGRPKGSKNKPKPEAEDAHAAN